MVTRTKTVSAVIARFAMQAAERHGIGSKEFYQHTGISELELRDPQARVSAAKHVATMRLLGQFPLTSDYLMADFGLCLSPFPTIAAVLTNSGSLSEAFAHYLSYRELIGEVDEVSMRRSGDRFEFEYVLEGEGRSAVCAYFNLALLAGLARLYDPAQARALSLELTGKAFAPPRQLRDAVGCEVRFEQAHNRIVLSAPGADARNETQNPFLHRFFLGQAKEERSRLWAMRSFALRVERFLVEAIGAGELLDAGNGLLTATCEHFGMSRWGLQRRLQPEAANFQGILAKVRAEEARRLLAQTRLPIAEISEQLGFSSLSAFSRFFSEQCGEPPSRFRDVHASLLA